MMAKKGWVKCKVCGAQMKAGRLKSHMKKVHPKGSKTKKEKAVLDRRREAAKSTLLYVSIAIIVALIIVLSILFWPGTAEIGTGVGNKPPNFTLSDPDGFKYTLYDYVEDDTRPLLLEIMKTDCQACRYLAPQLHDLYENYSDKIDFISVASYQNEDSYTVKNFMASYNSDWTYLVDSERHVFDGWQLTKWPTCFIIDKQGKISWTDKDSLKLTTTEELTTEIEAVLK
jgi:thiol-disulfide isomerase/thioredoxin